MRSVCNGFYRGWIADIAQWNQPVGRLLLLLTTLLLLVMPLTEHVWNGDHFLRGGGDVEFSLLAGLLFAALVILAMNRGMSQSLLAASLIWRGVVNHGLPEIRSGSTWMTTATAVRASLCIEKPGALPHSCTLQSLRI